MYQFAIIGCGRIAQRHAENIEKAGKLTAVCDIVPERAEALASQYQVNPYYSIDDLLEKEGAVDVVSICTPNGYHAEHSIKSLQAGKHVLCEKPLCITSVAAWQMMETEKFSGKKLFVVKSARFNPLLRKIKEWIEEGALGKLYSFQLNCFWNRPKEYYQDWHGKKFPDGGTLYTQFSHYIDAMLWLFGEIDAVNGFSSNTAHKGIIEFEDTGVASLKMKNEVFGTLNWSVNTYQKNSEIALTIIAEKGTLSLGGEYLNEVKYQQLPYSYSFETISTEPNDYSAYKGTMSHHKEVYQNLLEALQNKEHPFTNAFDGLKTVEAIEKIYRAVSGDEQLL